MELFEAIKGRHSYRGAFKDQEVRREHLKLIVEAGLLAPSGANAQTTSFVIVDNPELLATIGKMHKSNQAMQQAKGMIACIADKEPLPVYENFHFQTEDLAAAVQNMLLAITALGYASVWIDGWLRLEGHAERINHLLQVPPAKTVRVLLPIGVPLEPPTAKEKKGFSERAWFNRYGEA
ncbi:MAG: nitroreductase [Deltaproteobacteria bacterium]|nr:nitroreductase [Deltaproteobacteria bacterium]